MAHVMQDVVRLIKHTSPVGVLLENVTQIDKVVDEGGQSALQWLKRALSEARYACEVHELDLLSFANANRRRSAK